MQKIKVSSITIDRENRQRKTLTNIRQLQESIAKLGLLQPIVLDSNNTLIAGERRLTAWTNLYGVDSEIPVVYCDSPDVTAAQIIEAEENMKRENLSWQDEVLACLKIYELLKQEKPDITMPEAAKRALRPEARFGNKLTVARYLLDKPEVVKDCQSWQQAYNVITRDMERSASVGISELTFARMTAQEAALEARREPEVKSAAPQVLTARTDDEKVIVNHEERAVDKYKTPIQNRDFIQFAKNYNGKPFNFLHCDFPYGVDMQKSGQTSAEIRDKYNDSPDVYWELVETLLSTHKKILAQHSSIMFWLSMKHYVKTVELFTKAGFYVNPTPLIWFKPDNVGIAPKPMYWPRQVYETALQITKGTIPTVKLISNLIPHKGRKTLEQHQAEKPIEVLLHYFQAFIDSNTEMLDPTCGFGSSVRAAHQLGARRVVGLELNPDFADIAAQLWIRHNAQ